MGIVVSFELGGEPIGTIRIVPMGHGLTLTESLLEQGANAGQLARTGNWEVGRLVLAEQYRTDVEALRRCLYLALCHADATAHVEHLYAACTHVLSRLYRRFGFTALAREVPLPGTTKAYTVISGARHKVLEALSGGRLEVLR